VIPFHDDFTLIGTTEVVLGAPPELGGERLDISAAEADYLCSSVNGYLAEPISPSDQVWSFAGIRPLFDDATADASAKTKRRCCRCSAASSPPIVSWRKRCWKKLRPSSPKWTSRGPQTRCCRAAMWNTIS
ncbi:hypothetical protein ACFL12_08400, partial [Pseudomonadota bacterium]